MSDAINYISLIIDQSIFDIPYTIENRKGINLFIIIVTLPFLVIVEWVQREKRHALQISGTNLFTRNIVIRFLIYTIIALFICGNFGKQSEFIYFQF